MNVTDCVLVCGGSGGIGGALCRQFAAAGYHVFVGYASGARTAQALAHEIQGTALALDVTSRENIDAAVDVLADSPYATRGLVLAASPPPAISPIFRLPEGEMDTQWAVNVLGSYALLDGTVRRLMQPHKTGWIAGILSEAMAPRGRVAKSMGGYIVAKYGLFGLMKVLDAEYAWLDIHTIYPGYTETAMLDVFDSRFIDQMRAAAPGGRLPTADETATLLIQKILGT